MIDKLEHKKATTRVLKGKVNELSEQLRKAEAQLDELNTEVAALEEKRAKLCESVAADPDSDGDEDGHPEGETEYPPPGASVGPKGGKGKGKNKFRGKVKSWTLISGLNEQDLEEMLEVSRAELKRRRTGGTSPPSRRKKTWSSRRTPTAATSECRHAQGGGLCGGWLRWALALGLLLTFPTQVDAHGLSLPLWQVGSR